MTLPGGDELREKTRQQLLTSLGGWSGTVVAAIPPLVFVIANSLSGLRVAIIAALVSGALVAAYRLARRQPVQQALMGMGSVAVAAAIAARTGQARGFFLLGIAAAVCYAAVFAVSLLLRRPLVGVLWEFLEPTPLPPDQHWRRIPTLRRAYTVATCAALAMFASRAVVQLSLFSENRTGLLAITKLLMGYPLYIGVIAVSFWVVRRARSRLGLPVAADPAVPAADPATDPARLSGRADSVSDSGLSLGQRDEQ
jgi:intracellular septation protein A